MKLNLTNLFRVDGTLPRVQFLAWGMLLLGVKCNLDRLVYLVVLDQPWSFRPYLQKIMPFPDGLTPRANPSEFGLLLLIALPFLWMGVALSLKRLRSAGLPLSWAVLFVIPVIKWFLFLALILFPESSTSSTQPTPEQTSEPASRKRWPQSKFGSATLATALSALLAIGAILVSAQLLEEYGWAIFVGTPFCMGFLAALIHAQPTTRTMGESVSVGLISIGVAGAAILAFAFEGVICLVMAAPLAALLAVMGAVIGHAVQSSRRHASRTRLYAVPVLALPVMMGTDVLRNEPPPLLCVKTSIAVAASPHLVWRHVVSFTELPPPTEALFSMGIAYPIRAEIRGEGVGAVRHCVFSTGPFVEPIEVWDEPRLLKFSVTENPPPMQEWTPYREIHPPHLAGFLVSKQGQFLLTPLPNGGTQLEGTTWYHHGLWPAPYWQLWSDYIIHTIHKRVLNHVKNLAEAEHQ